MVVFTEIENPHFSFQLHTCEPLIEPLIAVHMTLVYSRVKLGTIGVAIGLGAILDLHTKG